jgi:23S rRNA (adenine2503-C2)-methyltransferase
MENILDYNLEDLRQWMSHNEESTFRAKQVFDFIYNGIWNFKNMNVLPKSTREKLNDYFYIDVPEAIEVLKSKDNDTIKFLLQYKDGNIIESVIMKYKHGNTICVSTQVGCRMGCKFCASTLNGMVRNLSNGEILGQILRTEEIIKERISNIVMMGSGEPLDNYENIIKFIDIVNSEYGLNIGQRHITISTCGLVPKIYELAELDLQITLAISLHAPNDELRRKMMPIANKYTIRQLISACEYYIAKTNKRVTFEYALVKNVNDSSDIANELGNLLKGMICHVNLIPVNQVIENNLQKSNINSISSFAKVLSNYGIEATIRREMGSDINAACGQLRRRYLAKNEKGV